MPKTKDETKDSQEDILRIARERFKLAEESWQDVYNLALEDLKFLAGDQWPDDVKNDRDREHRPCLTINRMPQFIRQITNDQRQNRPSIKVSPVDDKADVDTAKIIQGLIRHILVNSNADVAFDRAFEGAVGPSFGFFRVLTDYVSPDSFDLEARIGAIPNQFSVLIDPYSKEPDGSDMNWGFIFSDVIKDDYNSDHKASELAGQSDWDTIGNQAPSWINKDNCRVAEYFYKEFKAVTLVQLQDGTVLEKSQLPEGFPAEQIKKEREAQVPVVKWCKINGIEILEETIWPGQWIPIIPVYGNELIVDGKRILEGIIRHAKDPQRMYNYWASSETEMIALAPKAPFIVANGQISDEHKHQWQTANSKTYAYLTYEEKSINGQLIGPPSRNAFEPPVGAITNARMQSSEDLKATTGIYDAALGNRGNESSGIAIQRRNMQSQTSNFHFIDNLTRSLKHTGRILVDIMPHVYDTARVARILGEDGEQEIVKINEFFQKFGEDKIFNLGAGKYDVTVETGPSFATKRQEAVASMLDFMKIVPQHAPMVADLVAKNMDWAGATEFAERFKKMLPPGLADDKTQDKPPIPPEAQAQMQQMDGMIKQLTEQLTAVSEEMKNKKLEIESRERIEFAKLEHNATVELAKLESNEAREILSHQMAELNQRLSLVGMHEPVEYDVNESGPQEAVILNEMQQPQPGGLPPEQPQGV